MHRSVFVPGDGYAGMSDNDLRGFPDGAFAYGWNQAEQQHVRVGRGVWRGARPLYGEPEVFRCLQRWSGLRLPPSARVEAAHLVLTVESAPDRDVDVCLYAARKDWNPGDGGQMGDNTSPPAQGEVWWRAPAAGESEWALPGAGYAASGDSPSADTGSADTGAMPLARTTCRPGTETLSFSGPRLADYVAGRVEAERPCLFLLKLADADEDTPGTVIEIFSAEHGDSGNPARRPGLTLDWRAPGLDTVDREILLERGRGAPLPTLESEPGEWIACTFLGDSGGARPTVEVREGDGEGWREVRHPWPSPGGRVEMRIRAVRNPVPLGTRFEAVVRDTWVTSGAPESRAVEWRFLSPSGDEHLVTASYRGDYTWGVRFRPDEVGVWRYTWRHDFTSEPYVPATGEFDVVAGDLQAALDVLGDLEEEMREADLSDDRELRMRLGRKFLNLERAAVTAAGPSRWRGSEGDAVREVTRRIRSLLWGREVPDPIPMEAHVRPWRSSAEAPAHESRDRDRGGGGRLMVLARRIRRAVRRRIGL